MKPHFWIILLPLLAAACKGQHPAPGSVRTDSNIVIADRISNQRVEAFTEDADGHIWIGTFRGLNKYTIQDYHQYFCADDTLGLPDNHITALRRSAAGQLWIGTSNGVALHTDDGQFLRIPIDGEAAGINEILETRDGKLLFNRSGQLSYYDPSSGRIRSAIRDYGGYSSVVAPDGRLWTFTLRDLRCFDPSNFTAIGNWPTPHPAYHFALSSRGEIWLSGMGRLSIFDPRTEKWLDVPQIILQEPRLVQGDIDILFSNGADMLLHTITDGMFCYNLGTGRLLHQSDPGFPYDIPDFEIRTIFRDSRGNLWFGATDQGFAVSYADKNGFKGNRYLADRFERKSVISVCADRENRLWIATLNDGLFVYDLNTKDLRPIDLNRFVPDSNVGYIRCSSIFCDAQGEIWLAMTEKYQVLRCRYNGSQMQLLDRFAMTNPTTFSQDDLGQVSLRRWSRSRQGGCWSPPATT